MALLAYLKQSSDEHLDTETRATPRRPRALQLKDEDIAEGFGVSKGTLHVHLPSG